LKAPRQNLVKLAINLRSETTQRPKIVQHPRSIQYQSNSQPPSISQCEGISQHQSTYSWSVYGRCRNASQYIAHLSKTGPSLCDMLVEEGRKAEVGTALDSKAPQSDRSLNPLFVDSLPGPHRTTQYYWTDQGKRNMKSIEYKIATHFRNTKPEIDHERKERWRKFSGRVEIINPDVRNDVGLTWCLCTRPEGPNIRFRRNRWGVQAKKQAPGLP